MAKSKLTKKELMAQKRILESLKVDYYDIQDGLGGPYGDNYIGMKQIERKLRLIDKNLNKSNTK